MSFPETVPDRLCRIFLVMQTDWYSSWWLVSDNFEGDDAGCVGWVVRPVGCTDKFSEMILEMHRQQFWWTLL